MKPFAIALFLLLLGVPSFASSITMFNYGFEVNDPGNRFSIQMVPGTEQLLYSQRPFPWGPTTEILFRAVIDTSQTPISSLSWTFTSADTGSVTITFPPESCSSGLLSYCYGSFQIPTHGSNHGPFDASLIVNLNGTKQTYNFQYMIPIPEPATFLFLGTGLAAIGWRKYGRIGESAAKQKP